MKLSDLKRNKALLLTVLGIDKAGDNLRCPFHEDKNPSFSVKEIDGVWRWKCYTGCGSGTIIDAMMKTANLTSAADAFRVLEKKLGIRIGRDEELQEPLIDKSRAEKLIRDAHDNLMGSFELQEKYLLGKRGISNLDVVKQYRLGFMKGLKFKQWHWRLNCWVIPVTDATGRLLAVRLHNQGPRPKRMPKCLWAPVCEKKPYGIATLFPAPEQFAGVERLFITPGELKALAIVAVGKAATSPTLGEGGAMQSRLVKRLAAVKAKHYTVVFDNDTAGRNWRDKMLATLRDAGLAASAGCFTDKRSRVKKTDLAAWAQLKKSDTDEPWLDRWNDEGRETIRWISEHQAELPRRQFDLWPGVTITDLHGFYCDLYYAVRTTEEPVTEEDDQRMCRMIRLRRLIEDGLL